MANLTASPILALDDPLAAGIAVGVTVGGIVVAVALTGCIIYCKKKENRNRNDYVLGQRSSSYVSGLDFPDGATNAKMVFDPLEKRPYTQLTLPLGGKSRAKSSKYGVCRYKTKGQTTLLADRTNGAKPEQKSAKTKDTQKTQESKTKPDNDYTERRQNEIELYELPSYDLVVAESSQKEGGETNDIL